MTFCLSEQDKEFVSSADDLLGQFNSSVAPESITYKIFYDDLIVNGIEEVSSSSLESLVELRKKIIHFASNISSEYIWQKENFNLRLSFQKFNCGICLPYLVGNTRVGECIDDEWFIVYILLSISRDIPELSVYVNDNDGQFLLIEAADYIDEWLSPENALNRVWIKGGKVIIIPFDEPGLMVKGNVDLQKALHFIKFNSNQAAANSKVQSLIHNRTYDVYPARILAMKHKVVCLLPANVAFLLQSDSMILSKCVEAFSSTNSSSMHNAVTDAALKSLEASIDMDNVVCVTLNFSRILYAQLMFKTFKAPSKYHSFLRETCKIGDSNIRKAADIGCRLMCGLDCAYRISKKISISKIDKIDTKVTFKKIMENAAECGLDLHDSRQLKYLKDLSNDGTIILDFEDHFGKNPPAAKYSMDRDSFYYGKPFYVFVEETLKKVRTRALSQHSCSNDLNDALKDMLLEADSDDWMYMSPQEFETEMQKKVNKLNQNFTSGSSRGLKEQSTNHLNVPVEKVSSTGTEQSSTESDQPDKLSVERDNYRSMDNVVSSIDAFLQGESEFDGVVLSNFQDNRSNNKRKDSNTCIGNNSKNCCHSSNCDEQEYEFTVADLNIQKLQFVLNKHGIMPYKYGSDMIGSSVANSTESSSKGCHFPVLTPQEEAEVMNYFSYQEPRRGHKKVGFDTPISTEEQVQGIASFITNCTTNDRVCAENTLDSENGFDSDDDIDSDDEVSSNDGSCESQDLEELDNYLQDYQSAMERELMEEDALTDTFEWHENSETNNSDNAHSKEVDVELTVLKNFLEAQTQSAIGGTGFEVAPLAHMMAQMGISLPSPPAINSKDNIRRQSTI